MAKLFGKTIAFLEARRAQEMASLIERHGGVPYSAPALREVPLSNQMELRAFIGRLIAGPLDVVIFLTGVGARALLEAADQMGELEGLLAALQRAVVVARGPKPVAVLRSYRVRIDLVPPEPHTSELLLELLSGMDLNGRVVALQHYGADNPFLRQELLARGANLLEINLYQWSLPEDATPVLRFIKDLAAGCIDVVTFTSASQVGNLFAIAETSGLLAELERGLAREVLIASVGPVAERALQERGVRVDLLPEHPKMGHLVLAIAAELERRQAMQTAIVEN